MAREEVLLLECTKTFVRIQRSANFTKLYVPISSYYSLGVTMGQELYLKGYYGLLCLPFQRYEIKTILFLNDNLVLLSKYIKMFLLCVLLLQVVIY